MQDFLDNNLSSAAWWISVVLVGILLNIFSSYFRDYIDKFLSKMSSWWAHRTDLRTKRTDQLIRSLKADKFEFLNYQFENLRNWLRSIIIFVTAVTFVILTMLARASLVNRGYENASSLVKWATLPIGLILLLVYFSVLPAAIRTAYIITLVRDPIKQKDTPEE